MKRKVFWKPTKGIRFHDDSPDKISTESKYAGNGLPDRPSPLCYKNQSYRGQHFHLPVAVMASFMEIK